MPLHKKCSDVLPNFGLRSRIWKEIEDGILGSPRSKMNMINMESEGSTTPRVDNNASYYGRKVLNTSREDMVVGDWENSSTML